MILCHRELSDGDPLPGVEVQLGPVLDEPAAGRELPVDLDPRLRLGREVCLIDALGPRHRLVHLPRCLPGR